MDIAAIVEQSRTENCKEYDIFLSQLADPDIESSVLKGHLRSLRNCITLIDQSQELLVGILLKLDWTGHEKSTIQEYQLFFLNLVSAHTYYLRAILRMLVNRFLPKLPPIDKSNPESSNININEETRKKHEGVFLNVHLLLKAIVQIVPMAPSLLMSLLIDHTPYHGKDVYIHECYVRNLLQVTHYITSLRQKILEVIVESMIKLDVRSPRHAIEETEGLEDVDEDIVFDMEDADISREIVQSPDLGYHSRTDDREKHMSHQEANRLDVMMNLVLCYTQNTCRPDGELDWEATKKLYRELLFVFEKWILPTYASCHVQFIMFYLCSLRPVVTEGFLDFLMKKVRDPTIQAVFRRASVSYMGSLLARANFIPISTVTTCLELLCEWIHKYLNQTGEDSIKADVVHHGPFYATCQAVFYVFVFRNKEIFEMKKGYKWAESLNFQRMVTSRLNPLRVCQPLVVKTFASVTRMHQLAFCDTIIERNNRFRLPMATEHGNSSIKANLFDSFFPFDPYLLSRSGKFILPLYQEFHGKIEEDKSQDSEDEDDFLVDEPGPSSAQTQVTTGISEDKALMDFMEYGTSPGFKHISL